MEEGVPEEDRIQVVVSLGNKLSLMMIPVGHASDVCLPLEGKDLPCAEDLSFLKHLYGIDSNLQMPV